MNSPVRLLTESQIESVIAISKRAAAAILAVYNHADGIAVQRKSDASPLTAADLASHHIIVDGLTTLTSQWPILSEESYADIPVATRRSWSTYWLVDPMDGTKDFVNRTGEFAINIALIHESQPHWGLVYAPVSRQGWHGGSSYGSWQRVESQDTAITPTLPAQRPLRALISRNHSGPLENAIAAAIDNSAWGPVQLQQYGSSLKYCAIADGRVDFMPRVHPCSEWDTAAPHAILQGVGGEVTDLQGMPLNYNMTDSILVEQLIAYADPHLPWRDWLADAF